MKLTLDGTTVIAEEQFLHHRIGRIRNVLSAPDGAVYLLTDGREAWLYRMEPTAEQFARGVSPLTTGAGK